MSVLSDYIGNKFFDCEQHVLICAFRYGPDSVQDVLITKAKGGVIAGLPSPWSAESIAGRGASAPEGVEPMCFDASQQIIRVININKVESVDMAWLPVSHLSPDLSRALAGLIEGSHELKMRLTYPSR